MSRTLTATEAARQTSRRVGGDREDPVAAQAYAWVPGGPTYWSRAAFEAAVPEADRWRFVVAHPAAVPAPEAELAAAPAPAAPAATPGPAANAEPVTVQRDWWRAIVLPGRDGWTVYAGEHADRHGVPYPAATWCGEYVGTVPGVAAPTAEEVAALVAEWQEGGAE